MSFLINIVKSNIFTTSTTIVAEKRYISQFDNHCYYRLFMFTIRTATNSNEITVMRNEQYRRVRKFHERAVQISDVPLLLCVDNFLRLA
jgi:hypothetical protein